MKKLLGLSLVASATILTLNASAKDLSEAIKDVDVSGTVAYRYNDYESNRNHNNYKVATNISSKVNDDVTFNSRFLVESFDMDTSSSADSNVNVVLSEANFTYSGLANASLTIGKQGIDTPFTIARDAMGDETTGTGALATYTAGPVTFAGAYFNQTNITSGGNLSAFGIMGSLGPVNASAWYADENKTGDAYTVALDAAFDLGEVTVEPFIRYSDLDKDADNLEYDLFKVGVSASVGIFDAFLGYGETGKNGGVDLDGRSGDTTFDEHWRIKLATQADSDIFFANAGVQVTDELHVAVKHTSLNRPAGTADEEETYAQFTYKMSSNFKTYLRYGEYDKDGQEAQTSGRLHVQYSF